MAEPNPTLPELSTQDIERFWSKVQRGSDDECWPWKASTFRGGYGQFKVTPRMLKAHRVAYFLHYGIDPAEMLVCHKCDNPPCCNPHHLFRGTVKDNAVDASKKGRLAFGDRNWTRQHPELLRRGASHPLRLHPEKAIRGEMVSLAKLTEHTVKEIRAKYAAGTHTQQALADEYHISQTSIGKVVLHQTWKHI